MDIVYCCGKVQCGFLRLHNKILRINSIDIFGEKNERLVTVIRAFFYNFFRYVTLDMIYGIQYLLKIVVVKRSTQKMQVF